MGPFTTHRLQDQIWTRTGFQEGKQCLTRLLLQWQQLKCILLLLGKFNSHHLLVTQHLICSKKQFMRNQPGPCGKFAAAPEGTRALLSVQCRFAEHPQEQLAMKAMNEVTESLQVCGWTFPVMKCDLPDLSDFSSPSRWTTTRSPPAPSTAMPHHVASPRSDADLSAPLHRWATVATVEWGSNSCDSPIAGFLCACHCLVLARTWRQDRKQAASAWTVFKVMLLASAHFEYQSARSSQNSNKFTWKNRMNEGIRCNQDNR